MTWSELKKAVISWFADIRLYAGGVILFGDSHYEFKGDHMREALSLLQPGDVLLRNYKHYLGSIITPGYWSHAAIYLGDVVVAHMLGDGITEEDILVFMRCDDVAILRPRDGEAAAAAISKALVVLEEGMEYDFDFDSGNRKFTCTEFVEHCYNNPVFNNRLNDNYVMPDDFIDSIFDVVYGGIREKK